MRSYAQASVVVVISGLCSCVGAPTPLHPQFGGSVGFPHSGVQTDAIELPRSGAGFVRFRPHDRVYWGQPDLVNSIVEVATSVERQFVGGPPLVLGDLSARFGGKIPRHNSHRTGRDVDLLWHVMTPAGRPVRSPGFISIGPDGLAVEPGSGRYYRLDIDRQWAVVRAFLQSDEVSVQWMFCAAWIEALLVEHARARGEPDELIWRAQTVLLQPADSLPHDDHIHLRIACSPEQAISGCMGGGPHWTWIPPLPVLGELSAQDLEEIARLDPFVVVSGEEPSSG